MKRNWNMIIGSLFIFTLGLLTALLLVSSLTLRAKSAVLPIALCISILVLLCIDVLFRRWEERQRSSQKAEKKTLDRLPFGGKVGVTIWLLFSMALTYLFGFIIAILISTTLYFKLFGEKRITVSLFMSLVLTGLIYVGFIALANFDLYRGILLI